MHRLLYRPTTAYTTDICIGYHKIEVKFLVLAGRIGSGADLPESFTHFMLSVGVSILFTDRLQSFINLLLG